MFCPAIAFWSVVKSFLGLAEESNPSTKLPSTLPEESAKSGVLTDEETASLVAKARAAIYKLEYNDAVSSLLPVIDSDPDQIDANMLLGGTFLALNRADLAETFLHRAVQLTNWTQPSAVSNLAEALRINGDADLAIKVIQRGLNAINKTDSSGLLSFTHGAILEQQKKYSESADWYLASALAQPTNIEAWLRASTMLFPSPAWDLKFAENVLAQAVKLNPESSSLVFNLGVALHYSNRASDAVTLYAEALRLDPEHYGAMSNLATALHSLGRTAEASILYEVIFNSTIPRGPDGIAAINRSSAFNGAAVALGNYALLLNAQRRPQHALRVISRASELENENVLELAAVKAQSERLLEDLSARYAVGREALVQAVHSGQWAAAVQVLSDVDTPGEDGAWWHFARGMLHYFR